MYLRFFKTLRILTFKQAEEYLNSHVRQGSRQIFQGVLGLEKMRYFLRLLSSPQNKLKVIHVAGTAGKGSTCYLISSLLAAHGFKVGLHLSPHLTDVRERFQINNKVISKKEFVLYLNKVISAIEKVPAFVKTTAGKGKIKYGDLSYFEVLVGLAFYIFEKKKVDYVVIETGLGGLYDATNVVDRKDKVAVLTKIGFDHMEILGNTLKEIAYQKAMIINERSQVIVVDQLDEVKNVISEVAKKNQANFVFVGRSLINQTPTKNLGLIGEYQKENASLALKTVELLAKRDRFKIDKEKVESVFKTAHFIGRFDIKKINDTTVVLDGAHNPLKMESFSRALKSKYPDKNFHFLIAFKKGKDYKKMLNYIVPLASKITITSFFVDNQDLIHLSEKPVVIANNLKQLNYENYQIKTLPEQAFKSALETGREIIVVTGSLYLLGEIYRFIKNDKI